MPEGDFTSGQTRQCPDPEGLVVSEVAGAACGLCILVSEGPGPWPQASPAGRLDAAVLSVTPTLPLEQLPAPLGGAVSWKRKVGRPWGRAHPGGSWLQQCPPVPLPALLPEAWI